MIHLAGYKAGLEVQALRHRLKFIIGDPQITLCLCNAFMVELVHDESQIYPTHSSMVAPSLSKAVRTKVAGQAYIAANRCDEFPSLSTFDGERVVVCFRIEEDIIIPVSSNIGE